jgi:hypothetical protein
MPRTCLACSSQNRAAVDNAIAIGKPLRDIAAQVSISASALARHKSHVAQSIVKACERREERLGDTVLGETRRVREKAWDLLGRAEVEGDIRAAIAAAKLALESNETLSEMLRKAAEAGGNGGPMLQVAIVYSGQPPSHEDAENGPS